MKFVFVASGSAGNATLIDSGNTLIQVDMGITLKRLKEGLSLLHRNLDDIAAVMFTHDHTDHIGGAHLLLDKVPLFASEGTLEPSWIDFVLIPGEWNKIGDIEFLPFSVSHDAMNPVNFLFRCKEETLGYVTDAGYLSEENLKLLQNCDYYLFESNHDVQMELKSKRPAFLKQRVLGDEGHLSNIDSAMYLSTLIGPKTKEIYLAHLSRDCNTPEIALATHKRVYREKGVSLKNIILDCTSQEKIVVGGGI